MKSRLGSLNIHAHSNERSYTYEHTAAFQALKRRPAYDLHGQVEVPKSLPVSQQVAPFVSALAG